MRKAIQSCALAVVVVFSTAYSCRSQTGPTQPSGILSWTNPAFAGITGNCVYRCTQTGSTACTPAPLAIACSTTSTTGFSGCSGGVCSGYTDATVLPSTNYNYAVTIKVGLAEGAYSNVEAAVVPANPPAPQLNVPQVTKVEHQGLDLQARVEWRKQ